MFWLLIIFALFFLLRRPCGTIYYTVVDEQQLKELQKYGEITSIQKIEK